MQKEEYLEEEIDLRSLFSILAKKKFFIVIFTIVVTALAVVYVNIKTPIYEVKSIVRVGYIDSILVENINILETKLKIIFGMNKIQIITKDKGIVSDISAVKKLDNFLEITTQAYSNEHALIKNKEVLSFLQSEYKYKIDEYILKTNISIKNLEEQIMYVENVTKIEKEEQISFLNNVDLPTIENKIKFNKEKFNQYQENINQISKRRSTNDTQNMLSAMEILNYQNLLLNLQTVIENLNKEKQNILTEKIPTLKRSLEFDIKNKLDSLKNDIELEKLKLTNNVAKNSEIIGDILENEYPVKPKKALIIVVAFVTGFILSIFLVFFMQFISSMKRKDI